MAGSVNLKSITNTTIRTFAVTASLSLVVTAVDAEIITVRSMYDVKTKVENILEEVQAKDVLVAFDIDMTLIQAIHPATYYPNLKKHANIHKSVAGSLEDDKKELMEILVVNSLPYRLVENDTPQILTEFKEKGVKTIAFTASLTGKIEDTPRFEVKRYQDLEDAGLSFKDSFSGYDDVKFIEFDSYRGNYPTFYKGVLYANGAKGATTKGSVLVAFLKRLETSPKVVVMVDDKRKNLDDIEKFLKKYDPTIQFVGVEYQAAFDYAPEEIDGEGFRGFWQALAKRAEASGA